MSQIRDMTLKGAWLNSRILSKAVCITLYHLLVHLLFFLFLNEKEYSVEVINISRVVERQRSFWDKSLSSR